MAGDPVTYFSEVRTLMGWNQLVTIDPTGANNLMPDLDTATVLRVTDYRIGINQTGEAPDYVTGRQDRTAWKKGPIESQGDLSFPFVLGDTGGGTGVSLFKAAANLVKYPSENFTITSSVHPTLYGCKVNTATIQCDAGGEITSSAQIWGIVTEDDLATINSFSDTERKLFPATAPDGQSDSGGWADGATVAGNADLALEQIPMWDVVQVTGAPTGMFVIGFSLTVDNRLVRNYTMGNNDDELYSPWGLNAQSISANQRMITGTIKWQSNKQGGIQQVASVGLNGLTISIGRPSPIVTMTMSNCLWNATPPSLSPGDRVTVESSFTALGANDQEFDALLIT
jgi:hypothetical protein